MKSEDLRERVKLLKEEVGISYKVIAKHCGLTIDKMYKFTSGVRELSSNESETMEAYLLSQGY